MLADRDERQRKRLEYSEDQLQNLMTAWSAIVRSHSLLKVPFHALGRGEIRVGRGASTTESESDGIS